MTTHDDDMLLDESIGDTLDAHELMDLSVADTSRDDDETIDMGLPARLDREGRQDRAARIAILSGLASAIR